VNRIKKDRIKNDRIKSDRIKDDRIKSDRIKTDRINKITDPPKYTRNRAILCSIILEITTAYTGFDCSLWVIISD
jgi:hypothetical protein